jgi:hypothetical protein
MSSRQERSNHSQRRRCIAALAARLVAEDGISELALAKRKAARSLGLTESTPLPDDSEVEAELRSYQRLFQNQEQAERSVRLLRAAARLMVIMQPFNPYLTGAVLEGTAGRHAEIDIQLFPDSAKDVEIFLLNEGFDYHHSPPRTERAEAVLTMLADDVIANLVVYPRHEERVSFRTRDGRLRKHARLEVVHKLLAAISLPSR